MRLLDTHLTLRSVIYIPIYLILKIRTRWTQKLALACSLCLTIVMIAITITRASGIRWRGKLDSIWEVFFQMIAAEKGLILAAVSAFRALYISRAKERRKRSPETQRSRWVSLNRVLYFLLSPRTWRFRPTGSGKENLVDGDVESGNEFPSIPGGTLTGMRSFIDRQGQPTAQGSQVIDSIALTEEDDGSWPLSEDIRSTQ